MISYLQSKSENNQTFTSNRETDCRTALTRGLREYLENFEIIALGGRLIKFENVFENWAEQETETSWPAAWISSRNGSYEAHNLVSTLDPSMRLSENTYLRKYSEYVTNLNIEIKCQDEALRREISIGLEDYLNPVDFIYGFRLVLPHYFGAVAEYSLKENDYMDTPQDAQDRYKGLSLILGARVSQMKICTYPSARMRARILTTQ